MAKKIIAKDILLADYNRNKRTIESIQRDVSLGDCNNKPRYLVKDVLLNLKVNLTKFKLTKLEPMTENTLFKSFNFKDTNLYYLIKFTNSGVRLARIVPTSSGKMNITRDNISSCVGWWNKKDIGSELRYGERMYLLTTSKGENTTTFYISSSLRRETDTTQISNIYKESNLYTRVLNADEYIKAITLGCSNTYSVPRYADEIQLNVSGNLISSKLLEFTGYVDYNIRQNLLSVTTDKRNMPIDKSGYNRFIARLNLQQRLKAYKVKHVYGRVVTSDKYKNLQKFYDLAMTYTFDKAVGLDVTDNLDKDFSITQAFYDLYNFISSVRNMKNRIQSTKDCTYDKFANIDQFNYAYDNLKQRLVTVIQTFENNYDKAVEIVDKIECDNNSLVASS